MIQYSLHRAFHLSCEPDQLCIPRCNRYVQLPSMKHYSPIIEIQSFLSREREWLPRQCGCVPFRLKPVLRVPKYRGAKCMVAVKSDLVLLARFNHKTDVAVCLRAQCLLVSWCLPGQGLRVIGWNSEHIKSTEHVKLRRGQCVSRTSN